MQQRGSSTRMENEDGEQPAQPLPRGRHNSKLKVLVRSHAMREETSPPREPTPNHMLSPCIKLIPSPEVSSSPVSTSPCSHPSVVLSPSISRGNTPPCRSPACLSPTSTLVPSPISRCSSQSASSQLVLENCERLQQLQTESDLSDSPKYLNKLNKQNLEKDCKQTSHSVKKKYICDCPAQNCIKCTKGQERNFNNNLTNINNNVISSPNTLTVVRASSRSKLRQQSSSQGSFEGSLSNSPCLSRDSSSEQYTDTTGVDLEQFIPETLNRNAKDRALMLRIEQELVSLAKDKIKTHYKFPPMSSYQRMLVHRCAAYFGMDHNIESSGKCVVVNKTKNTRIPDTEFKEHIKEDIVFSEEPRRSILKRDSSSIEDYSFKSPDRSFSIENRRSKSFEEREEEYEKAKRRIFNREMHDASSDEFGWSEVPWSSTDSDYSSARYRLQPPDLHRRHLGKLIKVQSEETGETLRPCVAKSYSFGGYGGTAVLSRGDSVMSTHSAGARLLTKQDSAASSVSWRLSPSSSGYKSQSQMSESVTPSPTSTPHPVVDMRQDSNSSDNQDSVGDNSRIVWAVTDIQNVPKGSIIINPQTGKPLKNEDGSLYHYDPHNPPASITLPQSKPPQSPVKTSTKELSLSPSTPKRRISRLSPTRTKSNLTNTATSPSLPYSPPAPAIPQSKSFQYIQTPGDNVSNLPQQQFPVYGSGYPGPPPAPENNVPVYQQPYVVYTAPYGIPVPPPYDGRMETQMTEMSSTYYVPENSGPPTQTIVYQQPSNPYWNQQPIAFYQNTPQNPNSTNPHRFSVPMQPQNQSGFVSGNFTSNYVPQPSQAPQNTELVHMYPNQPVQVMYPSQPNPPNQVMYPNQPSVIYAQNPLYPSPVYHPQNIPQNLPQYPQNTPTPNSCASSASNPPYTGQVPEQNQPSFLHLAQSMQQMSLGPNQSATLPNHPNFLCNKGPPQFDTRLKTGTTKGNKFSTPKGFLMGSSQSSTGTNSPAATVVAGYCPQNPGMYRTPPETPPAQFNYSPYNTVPPMVFRQMGNMRTSTPGTTRSSRSPTPAGDISHFDRHRISLPPNLYHGMPYVLQSEPRIIPGRGQPSAYRHNTPVRQQSFNQGSDSRSHKGRKSKGNKQSQVGLPPSGKQI